MIIAANEKWKTNYRYWVRPYKRSTKYLLSNGTKHDEELFKSSSKCISNNKAMTTMMSSKKYIDIVKLFFSFLITEYGFKLLKETENGNAFYDVEYSDAEKNISISYENIEDYLQVIVFKLKNGKLPDYDDKTRTLHLNELNKKVLSGINKKEIEENNVEFNKFDTDDELERKLLKSAKELRLVLKRWDKILDRS